MANRRANRCRLIEGRGEYVPEIAIEPDFLIRQSRAALPPSVTALLG